MNTLISSRDIRNGSGQLGTYTNFTAIAGNFTIVPGSVTGLNRYTDTYNIETTINSLVVTLPSPSNVMIGWQCKINVNMRQVIGAIGTMATLTINDHLGNVVFVFFSLMNLGSITTSVMTYPSATFTLRDSTPTWIVDPDYPEKGKVLFVVTFNSINNTSTGYPFLQTISSVGNAYLKASSIDVNFLFPATITFIRPTNISLDSGFYSTGALPFSTIGFLKTGVYSIIGIITLTGVTNTTQFRIFLNGTTVVPIMISYNSAGSAQFLIKGFYRFIAGDTIQIQSGKTVVASSTTITTESYFNFNYVGN
jgi:hypothetical protein